MFNSLKVKLIEVPSTTFLRETVLHNNMIKRAEINIFLNVILLFNIKNNIFYAIIYIKLSTR